MRVRDQKWGQRGEKQRPIARIVRTIDADDLERDVFQREEGRDTATHRILLHMRERKPWMVQDSHTQAARRPR